jgi:dTDP-4-amino-4,6-dideoxygalactose transaminase
MRDEFLSFSPPAVGEEEIAEVTDALRSGWITTGPRVARFEDEFAALVGAEAALGLSSGTDAMQIGLATLGVGQGDEVLTTPMTFCSTAHVIEHVGATPVLVDVEPDTLCIDPEKVEAAIGPKTKAILPVHLYGHPCDMESLLSIAEKNKLHLVEDAAHALPATWDGRVVGSIGDFTAFSFYATKNLTRWCCPASSAT